MEVTFSNFVRYIASLKGWRECTERKNVILLCKIKFNVPVLAGDSQVR